MAKHRGGRGRAKRRRCAFVVVEECGNVPAPCQTSLKGVRPHSAGVGKPAKDVAHTGAAGPQLHGPMHPRMCVQGKKRRKSKRGAWFWWAISRVCLCPMTPPTIQHTHQAIHTPFPLHTSFHSSCKGCLCASFFFVFFFVQPSPRWFESPLLGLVHSKGMGG